MCNLKRYYQLLSTKLILLHRKIGNKIWVPGTIETGIQPEKMQGIVVLCNCTELQPPGNCSYSSLSGSTGRKPGKGLPPQSRQSAGLFIQSSEPLTRRRVCPPPPPRFRGEGHNRWRDRGWKSPNSDERTYTVVLYIYKCTLCLPPSDKDTKIIASWSFIISWWKLEGEGWGLIWVIERV